MRLSAGKLLALVAFTLIATGCVEDVPLGQDYDKKYDVVVVFCHERIHIQETCTPVEASTSDFIYTYGLFGKAAGHSITVTTQVKGDDWRHESNPVVVPHGRQWLDGTRVSRSVCAGTSCKLITRAYVDGHEVAKVGFAFESG